MKNIFYITLYMLLTAGLYAGTLQEDFQYSTVAYHAYYFPDLLETPINEIYAYSYNAENDTWTLVPFQIDEQTWAADPINGLDRWTYFIYPELHDAGILDHNKIFDDHDELVFMVNDLGDQAPDSSWIDDPDSKNNKRLEVKVYNPVNTDQLAYLYLYRSNTLDQNDIPSPYNMEYLTESDAVKTSKYTLGFSPNGVVDDIFIHKNGIESSTDLFDILKLRFYGRLDASIGFFPINATEQYLYTAPEFYYTKNPRVRVIRQTKHTLQINNLIFDEFYFWVKTKMTPYSASIWGGAKLDKKDFGELFPFSDAAFYPDSLRFSWDFNENVTGMKFVNPHNNEILVDGQPDIVNNALDMPGNPQLPLTTWGMLTGTWGTVFICGKYEEKDWDEAHLYYYDNSDGPQGQDPIPDTGDNKSYGDFGVNFKSMIGDTISLYLGYTAFFLPQTNMTQSEGDILYHNVLDTLAVKSSIKVSVKESNYSKHISTHQLFQNYPNPFNHSTRITYNLAANGHAKLEIFNTQGQLVTTLANSYLSKGKHNVYWNGTNMNGDIVPTGVYFYKLTTENFVSTRKLIMVR